LFLANTILERGFTVSSTYSRNITSHPTRTMLVRQNREFLAMKQAQATLCQENMGDELKYMGTANVVRDMEFMTRIFDGPQAKVYVFLRYGFIFVIHACAEIIGEEAMAQF
jgi:hypothetical protein